MWGGGWRTGEGGERGGAGGGCPRRQGRSARSGPLSTLGNRLEDKCRRRVRPAPHADGHTRARRPRRAAPRARHPHPGPPRTPVSPPAFPASREPQPLGRRRAGEVAGGVMIQHFYL